MRRLIHVPALLVICLSCVSTSVNPPPMAADPSNVGVALSLDQKVRTSLNLGGDFIPETVFFIRFENSAYKNYKNPVLLASNYKHSGSDAEDGVVFALNLPPGEYAPVAAEGRMKEYEVDSAPEKAKKIIVFFPRATIEKTRTVVAPGTIGYLGELRMDTVSTMKGADDVQMYYYTLFSGNEKRTGAYKEMLLRTLDSDYTIYVAPKHEKLVNSKERQTAFLIAYRKYFKRSNWVGHFDKRLSELKK
jgi:hypothetical protein